MDNLASSRAPGHGERRAALLSAAMRVLDRDGMRGLTYRSVAREAGVSHGLVRHHFGSRDALIHEAVLDLAERSLQSTRLESGTGRLEDLGAGTSRMVTDAQNLPGVDYELVLEARRRPELAPAVHALYDRYLDATRRELDRIGLADDEPLVRLVFAALDGLVIQMLVYGRVDEADAAIARLHELLADRLPPEAR
jgi:TetR/AcrR family transcriptional regulator, regulator of biofilm formation and stress response